MNLSRCDALMISVVRSNPAVNRVVLDIGIYDRLPVWYKKYRPCVLDRVLHFVPGQGTAGPALKLVKEELVAAVKFHELDAA